MSYRILCLVCDSRVGTLRRIRPYEVYACERCVRSEGFEEIQRRAPEYVAAFEGRHPGKTMKPDSDEKPKEKTVMELAREHRDERLEEFEPDNFYGLIKKGKADY